MALQVFSPGSTIGNLSFSIAGDGTATAIVIDLSQAPFNLEFGGNFPVGFGAQSVGFPGIGSPPTASFLIDRNLLTVTFSAALPAAGSPPSQYCSVGGLGLLYGGVS